MNNRFKSFTFFVWVLFFLISIPVSVQALWNIEVVNNNSLSLDTIWGTSSTNIYAISFAGKVFQKGALTNGTSDWADITSSVFPQPPEKKIYLPFGIWGTGANDVYLASSLVEVDTYGYPKNETGIASVFHFDGSKWSEIYVSATVNFNGTDYKPTWLAGIWGTSPNDMYFTGGFFYKKKKNDDPNSTEYVDAYNALILHYNASATPNWSVEVSIGDELIQKSSYKTQLPMINEIKGVNNDIYAVGLNGLLLHKTISTNTWSIMPVESMSLNFFRVWAANSQDVFACGFNNSNSKAIVYRYNGTSWLSMTIPVLKEGYIPSLWGIWGCYTNENGLWVHSVGNGGTSLYYDGNPQDSWQAMVSGTTTSLNCVWGTSFNDAYASGEDGNIYHYQGQMTKSDIGAYPRTGIASQSVQFTDLSPGIIDRWEWDFGEKNLESVAPSADLDYKILVTAKDYTVVNNGDQITILDNGNKTGIELVSEEAKSATADLDGKIHVTAKPGSFANRYSIIVQPSIATESNIFRYGNVIFLKIVKDKTTQAEMAELIRNQSDIVSSVQADSPGSVWLTGNSALTSTATFKGGLNYTIKVFIDSGVTTQKEIADALMTHPKIASAVADSPSTTWVRGREQVSNTAVFSGGLANRNFYVNSDMSIQDYFKATHTYKNAGIFKAKLTVHRPSIPSTVEFIVKKDKLDGKLNYNEAMAVMSAPGAYMNGFSLDIKDCGESCSPFIAWSDENKTFTVFVSSGVTKQWEVANLIMSHPLILAAYPSVPNDPWYVDKTNTENPPKFYGGFDSNDYSQYETSEIEITVLPSNPLDISLSESTGVESLDVEFKDNSSSEIRNRIIKWTWYLDYVDQNNPGSTEDGTVLVTTSRNTPVRFQYNKVGTYNVRVVALLNDNSPFTIVKNNAIVVKSVDEDRSSMGGGSGLDNFSGCFIGSVLN